QRQPSVTSLFRPPTYSTASPVAPSSAAVCLSFSFTTPLTLLGHPRSSRFAKRSSAGHSSQSATAKIHRSDVETLPQQRSFFS
ncbi:hypothetical protein JDV02_010523, partial [Purpureocillium takamizusanense]